MQTLHVSQLCALICSRHVRSVIGYDIEGGRQGQSSQNTACLPKGIVTFQFLRGLYILCNNSITIIIIIIINYRRLCGIRLAELRRPRSASSTISTGQGAPAARPAVVEGVRELGSAFPSAATIMLSMVKIVTSTAGGLL